MLLSPTFRLAINSCVFDRVEVSESDRKWLKVIKNDRKWLKLTEIHQNRGESYWNRQTGASEILRRRWGKQHPTIPGRETPGKWPLPRQVYAGPLFYTKTQGIAILNFSKIKLVCRTPTGVSKFEFMLKELTLFLRSCHWVCGRRTGNIAVGRGIRFLKTLFLSNSGLFPSKKQQNSVWISGL